VPRPGSACSAYLLQSAASALLLDCGSGALGKLQLAIGYASLDAVVISHMHADHFFDLVPLRQGLKYGVRRVERLPVFVPPGGLLALEALRHAVAPDAPLDFFSAVYTAIEYDPSEPMQLRDVSLRFARTRHYIEGYAIRAECDGASLTYSGDTAPCASVTDLARGSDVFLCEAALGLGSEDGERGHSSAQEAGEMANRARVARLVITHYGSAYPAEALIDAAKRRFAGPVVAAHDGDQLSIFGSPSGSEN
jgi:ribonuclease BN (tRNA processing enzyme)